MESHNTLLRVHVELLDFPSDSLNNHLRQYNSTNQNMVSSQTRSLDHFGGANNIGAELGEVLASYSHCIVRGCGSFRHCEKTQNYPQIEPIIVGEQTVEISSQKPSFCYICDFNPDYSETPSTPVRITGVCN